MVMPVKSDQSTPILFLIYNRPDLARAVFERIRQWQPQYLFIAADGPRAERPRDIELTRASRALADEVDWDCEVQVRFNDRNLGCLDAVSGAITWFFEHVDAGIILEDDCLPDPSFFPFCAKLLERYRDHLEVMHIGATTPIGLPEFGSSYYFSRYNRIWGWATWKRAWSHFDRNLSEWPSIKASGGHRKYFDIDEERELWERNWDSVRATMDTWDFQWFFCRLMNGLGIVPHVNLVSNLGFRSDATHTVNPGSDLAKLPTQSIAFPLKHPVTIERDSQLDHRFFNENIRPKITPR